MAKDRGVSLLHVDVGFGSLLLSNTAEIPNTCVRCQSLLKLV